MCVGGGRWAVGLTLGVWAAGKLWGSALPPHYPFLTLPLITGPFPRGHCLQSHLQPGNDRKGPSPPARRWGATDHWTRLTIQRKNYKAPHPWFPE